MSIGQNLYEPYVLYETLTPLSAVIIAIYLKAELKSGASLKSHWRWIAGAMALQLVGETIYRFGGNSVWSDFYLHALSGGIISLCLFYYLVRTFKPVFQSWRLELLAFFMFVSTFGVINELMEYAFDTVGLGQFSSSRLDTWRDLAANTVGSLVFWLIYRCWQLRSRK